MLQTKWTEKIFWEPEDAEFVRFVCKRVFCAYVQVNECQVIMPLSLATDQTCVVLAGDHLQMGQKVYSEEAVRLNFEQSLVERLHRHYEDEIKRLNAAKQSALRNFSLVSPASAPIVRLKVNYRNHPEILKFISSVYYNGENVLKSAASCHQSADGDENRLLPMPLNFYEVCGEEKQDPTSTSWYNLAEINEVVDRVEQLRQSWPTDCWGEMQLKDILVTASYVDQVCPTLTITPAPLMTTDFLDLSYSLSPTFMSRCADFQCHRADILSF
jgi:superfamily I DNA and/or RNA helicase